MSVTRRLGATALVLGAAAPFAGSPFRAARGKIDVEALAGAVARGEDHVDAIELARWIKERRAGLRVIDLRTAAEFADFAIPTAENIPIEAIGKARFAAGDQVVLYSEGGAHGGQAWVFLRALGLTRVWFLAGGLAEWNEQVLGPVLPAGATEDQKRRFEADAEVSRYFGGTPRTGGDAPAATARVSAASPAAPVRRRGC